MSSLILELQRDSLDVNISVSNLLRKALIVAKKLQLKDFENWINLELNGYPNPDEIPLYRLLKGDHYAFTETHGWQKVMIHNLDEEWAETLSTMRMDFPISRLESDLKSPESTFVITYDTAGEQILLKAMNTYATPGVLIWRSKLEAILDAVRNTILDWSLRLEQQGVLGEGMNFTYREKEVASTIILNIENFNNQKSGTQIQQTILGDFTMGDKYKTGQAGAVGPNAHAHDMNFNQIWSEISGSIDTEKLGDELAKLRLEM